MPALKWLAGSQLEATKIQSRAFLIQEVSGYDTVPRRVTSPDRVVFAKLCLSDRSNPFGLLTRSIVDSIFGL